jgi:hypothetical protein
VPLAPQREEVLYIGGGGDGVGDGGVGRGGSDGDGGKQDAFLCNKDYINKIKSCLLRRLSTNKWY